MFELNDPNETVSLEQLDHKRIVIGLEAMNLSQTINAMVNRFPTFLNGVNSYVNNVLGSSIFSSGLVDSRKLEAKLRTVDYVSAAQLGVYVPAGFKGYWLDYTGVLNRSQKVLDDLREGLLKPFETYLALLLTNPENLRNNSVSPQLARYKSPDMDALKKEFAKFFTSGQETESTYGAVVKRHADLSAVSRELNEVNTRFASIDRKVLIKQVTAISDLLGQLMTNAKEHPDEYVISGAQLKALANLTFFMAREVEFYTTHGYFLDAFTLAVTDSYKRLYKALDK